jgi:hypothetical protein
VLRYWHDLSYGEIAEVTGLSESAVKTRLFRAREWLAKAMKPVDDGGRQPGRFEECEGNDGPGTCTRYDEGGQRRCDVVMLGV